MEIRTGLMAIALFLALASHAADAATTKRDKRSNYSKEQQAKFFAEALRLGRKEYNGTIRVKVDYARRRYVCYIR